MAIKNERKLLAVKGDVMFGKPAILLVEQADKKPPQWVSTSNVTNWFRRFDGALKIETENTIYIGYNVQLIY